MSRATLWTYTAILKEIYNICFFVIFSTIILYTPPFVADLHEAPSGPSHCLHRGHSEAQPPGRNMGVGEVAGGVVVSERGGGGVRGPGWNVLKKK